MPVVGAVIGGVASIGGSLLSSSSSKSAANAAAAAQERAAQLQVEEQRRQYDQTRSDLSPWMTTGTSALGAQGDLLGLNGYGAQQSAITAQKSSPLYESLFRNGQETLLQNASATGGLRGGNTQGALANFGRDTLAQVIEAQLSRLGGVSAQGQNAAAQVGAFGANSANAIGQALGESGAAQAGAYLANGAANASSIKDITGAITGLANNDGVIKSLGKLF
jgi:type II secretory pathway pseudopilin PulG